MKRVFSTVCAFCLLSSGLAYADTAATGGGSGGGTAASSTKATSSPTASSAANIAFARAIQLYEDSQKQDAAHQKAAAIEVLRIFNLIATAYPDSVPGKRILAGGQIGPIDLAKLRVLAGEKPAGAAPTGKPASASTAPKTTVSTPAPMPKKKQPLKWYQLVVPAGTDQGGYAFGQYPSLGQRTHPGVDLISACGDNVTAPQDGTVVRVIKPGDEAFPQTGNGLVIDENSLGKDVYTAFFFLGAAPKIDGGRVHRGQVIGVTGRLPDRESCGVHFEVRNQGITDGLFMPYWHGVLGVGDWRKDPAFLKYWSDPVAWLKAQLSLRVSTLLAKRDWVSIYAGHEPASASFDTPAYFDLKGPSQQWLTLQASVRISKSGNGVDLEITNLLGTYNPSGQDASQYETAARSFSLHVQVSSKANPAEAVFDKVTKIDASYVAGQFTPPHDIRIQLPQDAITNGKEISLSVIPDRGPLLPLSPSINLGDAPPSPGQLERGSASHLANILTLCTAWTEAPGKTLTLKGSLEPNGQAGFHIGKSAVVSETGMSADEAARLNGNLVAILAGCGSAAANYTEENPRDWAPILLVLGRSAK